MYLKSIGAVSVSSISYKTHTKDNQRDLEMATEMLSEYLERDITKDSLVDMKILVQDKTK